MLKEYTEQDKKLQQFVQRRFQVKNINMQMVSIKKSHFAGLNDKSYYFSDGICSLPYGHYFLNNLRNEKENYKHIHRHVQQVKYGLLHDDNKSTKKCERIHILRSIVNQPFTYFKLDSNKRPPSVESLIYSTKHYILNGYWF